MALGKNIEHLRNELKLTRIAVAKAIGRDDDQAIYALETRDSNRSDMAPALAKFFEVDLEALVTQNLVGMKIAKIRATYPYKEKKATVGLAAIPPAADSGMIPTQEALELIELYGRSTPEGRENIMMAARLAEKRDALSGVGSSEGASPNDKR